MFRFLGEQIVFSGFQGKEAEQQPGQQ